MTEAERMELALAMGLDPAEQVITYSAGNVPAFDPEHDANDDYAVLEWMRGKYAGNEDDTPWDSEWFIFRDSLFRNAIDYEIGDYARAALKVIDND